MKLFLARRVVTERGAIGDIREEGGVLICFTQEAPQRIPAGTYQILIDNWRLPRVLSVPGFETVHLHANPPDEDGGILTGMQKVENRVIGGRVALESLQSIITEALKTDTVFLVVKDEHD